MSADLGAMPTARDTHEPSRKRLGLTVGIAIALAGCALQCTDPGALAVAENLKRHPEEWQWDGLFLYNEARELSFWRHSIDVWGMDGNFSMACRAAISDAAAPIKLARDKEAALEIAARAAGIEARSGETGTGSTGTAKARPEGAAQTQSYRRDK